MRALPVEQIGVARKKRIPFQQAFIDNLTITGQNPGAVFKGYDRQPLAWGGIGTTSLSFLGRQKAYAGDGSSNKRLLFIFQRGGNDGLNTIVPHGDNLYSSSRPSIGISLADMTAAGTDLGNNFAGLHPQMAPIMSVFTPGELAVIHRVGYADQSRSHFDSQDYWEKGDPRGNQGVKDGMLYRQLAHMLDLMAFGGPIGLLFGRIANFINGELVGRACSADFPLAVKFPQAMMDWLPRRLDDGTVTPGDPRLNDLFNGIHAHEGWLVPQTNAGVIQFAIEKVQQGDPAMVAIVEPLLTPRYPSQIQTPQLQLLTMAPKP